MSTQQRTSPQQRMVAAQQQRMAAAQQRMPTPQQRMSAQQRMTPQQQRMASQQQRIVAHQQHQRQQQQRQQQQQQQQQRQQQQQQQQQMQRQQQQRMGAPQQRMTPPQQRMTPPQQAMPPAPQNTMAQPQQAAQPMMMSNGAYAYPGVMPQFMMPQYAYPHPQMFAANPQQMAYMAQMYAMMPQPAGGIPLPGMQPMPMWMPGSPSNAQQDQKRASMHKVKSEGYRVKQQQSAYPPALTPRNLGPVPNRHVTPESVKVNPYDIMTSKVWSAEQHSRFIRALHKHGRQWKLISQELGTHTSSQVRSHAQKYFQKLQKLGMGHLIPPARQYKRKMSNLSNHHGAPYNPVKSSNIRHDSESTDSDASYRPSFKRRKMMGTTTVSAPASSVKQSPRNAVGRVVPTTRYSPANSLSSDTTTTDDDQTQVGTTTTMDESEHVGTETKTKPKASNRVLPKIGADSSSNIPRPSQSAPQGVNKNTAVDAATALLGLSK